jgi:hypothetical protein
VPDLHLGGLDSSSYDQTDLIPCKLAVNVLRFASGSGRIISSVTTQRSTYKAPSQLLISRVFVEVTQRGPFTNAS